MHRRLTGLVPLVLTTIVLCPARAETRDIDRLAQRADAIVIGQLEAGWQSGYSVWFDLSVVRSLKGSLAPGAAASVTWNSGLRAERQFKGNYGMWFLSQVSAGKWGLLGVLEGQYPFEGAYLPMSKNSNAASVTTGSPTASISDTIAVELVASMQVYTDYRQLIGLATGFYGIGDSAVLHSLYESLRANSDAELRFIGLTGLVREGDVSALAEVAANLDIVSKLHVHQIVGTICNWRNPASVAIGYLAAIASSPDADLQRCAAEDLDFIHTADTLPLLAKLLDSTDPKTREYAIQGLSRFVDNLPIQTPQNVPNGAFLVAQGPTPYRTSDTDKYSLSRGWLEGGDEVPYLQFWKSWWSTMQGTLISSPQ
jgi:hypothetical protein